MKKQRKIEVIKLKGIVQKYKGKISWVLVGNLFFALSQWGIISVLARATNNLDLAIYSIALAITAPIILFFNLDLRTIVATDFSNQYKMSEYIGSRIIYQSFAFLIIILTVLFFDYNLKTSIVIILIGILKIVETVSDILMAYFQRNKQIDIIGKSQLLRGLYSFLFFSISYFILHNLYFSLITLIGVNLFRLYFYDIQKYKAYKKLEITFNRSIWYIFIMALPLGLTALLISLIANVPRYGLSMINELELVGVFSALYYVLVASNLVISPMTILLAPHIASVSQNKNKKEAASQIIRYILLAIVIYIVLFSPLLILGERLLLIFYGESYSQYTTEFRVLILSMFFSLINSILNLSIISYRKLRVQAIGNLIVLIIVVLTAVYLIPNYQLLGAALVVVLARFTQTVTMMYILWKKILKGDG